MAMNHDRRNLARRKAVVAAFATCVVVVGLGTSATATATSHGTTNAGRSAAKLPAGMSGSFISVASVPHSSDVWAVGSKTTRSGKNVALIAHRHSGRWTMVKPPALSGGTILSVSAASAKSVWFGGERGNPDGAHGTQDSVWRWTGHAVVAVKLPAQPKGYVDKTYDVDAVSPSDVWAVGEIAPASNAYLEVLHYNGKQWLEVAYPESEDMPVIAVNGSSATNAWATDGTNLFHWDGKTWTTDGTAPSGAQLNSVATVSPKLAYAVGFALNGVSSSTVIMRFNGTTWTAAALGKGAKSVGLFSVAMHGTAAWAVGDHTILHSTGGVWKPQASLPKTVTLESVSAAATKRAYAVGVDSVIHQATDTETYSTLLDVYSGRWKPTKSTF